MEVIISGKNESSPNVSSVKVIWKWKQVKSGEKTEFKESVEAVIASYCMAEIQVVKKQTKTREYFSRDTGQQQRRQ